MNGTRRFSRRTFVAWVGGAGAGLYVQRLCGATLRVA